MSSNTQNDERCPQHQPLPLKPRLVPFEEAFDVQLPLVSLNQVIADIATTSMLYSPPRRPTKKYLPRTVFRDCTNNGDADFIPMLDRDTDPLDLELEEVTADLPATALLKAEHPDNWADRESPNTVIMPLHNVPRANDNRAELVMTPPPTERKRAPLSPPKLQRKAKKICSYLFEEEDNKPTIVQEENDFPLDLFLPRM